MTSRDGAPAASEDVNASTTPDDDPLISGKYATSIPSETSPATPGEDALVAQGFSGLAIPDVEAPLSAVISTSNEIKPKSSLRCATAPGPHLSAVEGYLSGGWG